jgi:tripartite-type tricarboxylate transporter receptor subunit TctC
MNIAWRKRMALGILGCAVVLGGASLAQEKFPSRPIEIIATFGPGGGADLMARKVSQVAEPILGVPLPVSNVAGASGNAGLTKVLTSTADGHTVGTLIALTVSAWAIGIGSARPEDFTIVAVTQDSPSMLFVAAESPFKTFKDFLDYASANPGKLKVATSGYGTQDDITLKYLGSIGYKAANMPFAKPEERYGSLLKKYTDALYEEPGDVVQFLRSKQYRPLVVFDDERHPSFAEVPASKELGLDINDLSNFRTLAVPAKTPPERVKVLADAFSKALDSPEWKKYCTETYSCTKKYTPDEAKAHVKKFYETVQKYLTRFLDVK